MGLEDPEERKSEWCMWIKYFSHTASSASTLQDPERTVITSDWKIWRRMGRKNRARRVERGRCVGNVAEGWQKNCRANVFIISLLVTSYLFKMNTHITLKKCFPKMS